MAKKNSLPVAASTTEPMRPSKEDREREMRYRAESAMSDIERAEGHKKDKELMGHVKKLVKEKIKNLKEI